MNDFLQMRGIGKRFGATVALQGVDLGVAEGEIHALVGENGSGKSTLMRILAGAIQGDEGTMTLGGEPYAPRNPADGRKAGVAMIHQELSVAGHLSVVDNVLLGMEDSRFGFVRRAESKRRVKAALAKLGQEDLDVDTPAREFPIAVRQLVEIARAVAVGSRVVVLDEPTSSLTEADVLRLFEVVKKLREDGHAVLYISHFLDELHALADRMTVLRDGQLVGTRTMEGVTDETIVTMMVGRSISEMYPRSVRHPQGPILEVSLLAGLRRPDSATFTLNKGEVLGIAGLNGSGRTELLRVMFGLDRVKSGEIRLGVYQGPASPARRWAEGMGLLSENRKEEGLAINLSIADNITFTTLPRGLVNPAKLNHASEKWIEKLGIRCQGPEQRVGDLSGGNQQKVAIARMLHHGVDVLLLDEPTRGIDVGSKEGIYRLIDEAALSGKAVLMVSSYLPELLGTCDRIAVMRKGVLGEPRRVEEVNQESLMHEAVGA
jgi:ribose transport system ATP-binding protein